MPTDTPASTAPWPSRPIFISSTFADMQAERSYLASHVFPRLEEELRKRRHQFEPIDLRTGVLTADMPDVAPRELHVLKVCLEEIDRSRPFLIVLLGERYGTVPAPERIAAAAQEKAFKAPPGMSVTALEIEFGLIKKDAEQRQRSFIYLRNPLPVERMRPETAKLYDEAHAEGPHVAALRSLKQRLQDDPELRPRIHSYTADWDEQAQRVVGLQAFGEMVYEHLWQELDAETALHAAAPAQSWQDEERAALREFIDQRRRDFTGREDLLGQLADLARSPAAADSSGPQGACIAGAPGAGKSALWAELHQRLSAEPGLLILANAAGATQRGAQLDSMLRRFIAELAAALGTADPLPESAGADEVESTFYSLLSRNAVQRRVVVVLDALDQFEPSARAQQLAWLRPARWPANARLLATSQADAPAAHVLARHAGVRTLSMPALAVPDIEGIAMRVCARYHRRVDPQVLAVLAAKRLPDGSAAAGNPLWLTLALEQLNLLDADDFERAERDYKHIGDPAARLRALIVDTAQRMPPAVQELYGWLLDYTERAYGLVQARSFAAAIALSRFGWRESDLIGIVPRIGRRLFPDRGEVAMDELAAATLRRGFRAHLVRRGAAGQLDFLHAQMRMAVLQRAAAEEEQRRPLHAAISDYLETLPEDDPLIELERMGQLLAEHDALRAARYYATLDASKADPLQRSGSTWALVEWLTTADSQGERSERLAWLCGWLEQPELANEEIPRLADNFVYGLAKAMKPLLATGVLGALLQAAQAVWQEMVVRDPANARWQHDLAASQNSIGAILQAQGDLVAAAKAFRAGMEIAERLAGADPANARWLHDLSASQNSIGDILQAQGDLAGASEAFRAGMEITARLARADPANVGRQGDLAVWHERIGSVLQAQGDLAGAATAFRAGMEITERLARSDPASWQRGLSLSHNRMGNILQAQGDLAGALEGYRTGMEIAERLARADPANADRQSDLVVWHNQIGDVLKAQGDIVGALKAFRAATEIAERLARADPANADWQRDLVVSHHRLYLLASSAGNESDANHHLVECATILRAMKKAGMHLDVQSHGFLAQLDADGIGRGGIGRTAVLRPSSPRTITGLPSKPSATVPPAVSRPTSVGTGSSSPVAPTRPDPNSAAAIAARLNIEYQQSLARWQALPWLQRMRSKRPEPPQGI